MSSDVDTSNKAKESFLVSKEDLDEKKRLVKTNPIAVVIWLFLFINKKGIQKDLGSIKFDEVSEVLSKVIITIIDIDIGLIGKALGALGVSEYVEQLRQKCEAQLKVLSGENGEDEADGDADEEGNGPPENGKKEIGPNVITEEPGTKTVDLERKYAPMMYL